jgi:glutathione synthase/RimK-type ligase-like ATP-grasp enzyme
MWFHQDGAPGHYSQIARAELDWKSNLVRGGLVAVVSSHNPLGPQI